MEDMEIVPVAEEVGKRIYSVRGQNVMLDSDLAALYGVATGDVNQAVKRNLARFPSDFMFTITEDEAKSLISQTVISNATRGGRRRSLPTVFTQEGVAMLSSVLRSERAMQVNIAIMRAFVGLRHTMASHQELAWKITQIEQKYDEQFGVVFEAIRRLIETPPAPERRMGFREDQRTEP